MHFFSLIFFIINKRKLLYSQSVSSDYLSCICNCFQLQRREAAPVNDFLWDGQSVPHIWRAHTGQRTGLYNRIWVPQANLYCSEKTNWSEEEGSNSSSRRLLLVRFDGAVLIKGDADTAVTPQSSSLALSSLLSDKMSHY